MPVIGMQLENLTCQYLHANSFNRYGGYLTLQTVTQICYILKLMPYLFWPNSKCKFRKPDDQRGNGTDQIG